MVDDQLAEYAAYILAAVIPETNEHHQDTPERYIKMLRDLTYREEFKFTTFPNYDNLDEMVVQTDIQFYSLCAHHVIPFFGRAHVAYVPHSRIVGLSKLARAVRYFSKGLLIQEGLTHEIADFIEEHLKPKGVGVVMEAEHLCMAMRGVQVPGAVTTTAAMRGVFGDHSRTAKAEFMATIERSRR